MPNLIELGQSVQDNLADLGAHFFDIALDINPAIQDGYNLVAGLCETIEDQQTINWVGELVYYDFSTRLTDYLRIFGIYNNNTNRWLQPVTYLDLWKLRDNWELANGEPIYYIPIDYKTVAFFPVLGTSTGTMTVMFKKKAPTLTANSIPIIPIEHHNVLETYATGDLLDQIQEWTKALEYMGMMNDSIDKIRKVLRERMSPNYVYFKQG